MEGDCLVDQMIEKRYEKMAKNNSDGEYTQALNWYNAWTKIFKTMTTTENKKQRKNQDILSELMNMTFKDFEKIMLYFISRQQFDKIFTKEIGKIMDNILS